MEAGQIFSQNQAVQKNFRPQADRLKRHLEEFANKEEKGPERLTGRLLSPLLRDFLTDLTTENKYRETVISCLRTALFPAIGDVESSYEELYRLTGLLLSRLVNDGYVLDDLYTIAKAYFTDVRKKTVLPFREQFESAMRTVVRPPSRFTVTFHLTGVENKYDNYFTQPLAGVDFLRDLGNDPPVLASYARQYKPLFFPAQAEPTLCFARVTVKGVNHRSAALAARAELSAALDLLRFEVMPESVSIHEKFLSQREGENGTTSETVIVDFPQIIPNPLVRIDQAAFNQFVGAISRLYAREGVDADLKNRVQAAFRQYRIGRDTFQLPNKFLNWWTALENMTKSGVSTGTILEAVHTRLVPCLVLTYLTKLLDDQRSTFEFLKTKLPASIAADYAPTEYVHRLSHRQLFDLYRNEAAFAELCADLSVYPYFVQQLQYFASKTVNAAATHKFLLVHEQRLDWHLHRLYRMRNAIVHSAATPPGVVLLSANLEYYLKTMLSIILTQVQVTPSIRSLGELFDRIQDTKERLMNDLKSKNEAVLFDQVLTEQLT